MRENHGSWMREQSGSHLIQMSELLLEAMIFSTVRFRLYLCILVLCGGKVSGIVDARTATKEEIGLLMTKV